MNVIETLETPEAIASDRDEAIAAVRRLAEAADAWRAIAPFDDSEQAQALDAALVPFGYRYGAAQ